MALESLGKVDEREVHYFNSLNGYTREFPADWMLFIIASHQILKLITEFAKLCLDNNVLYICCAGEASSIAHDIFDEIIVWEKVSVGNDDYSDSPCTTFDKDIPEGFWFATVAEHETKHIENVVCANFLHLTIRIES